MSLKKYLLDKIPQIIISIIGFIIFIFMINAFKLENSFKIALSLICVLIILFNVFYDYFRKNKFYNKLSNILLFHKSIQLEFQQYIMSTY